MKRSYTGGELRPYVAAAESFLKGHPDDFFVSSALKGIEATLLGAGPVHRVADLGTMEPRTKARAMLAMLRERGVPPLRIFAVALGVMVAIEEDPYGPGGDRRRFRHVQIAKALRRRASGTHAVYGPDSRYDRYPRSSGRVLEVLGAMVDELIANVADDHLPTILDLKITRYGALRPPAVASIAQPKPRREDVQAKAPEGIGRTLGESEGERQAAERDAEALRQDFSERGFAAFKGKF